MADDDVVFLQSNDGEMITVNRRAISLSNLFSSMAHGTTHGINPHDPVSFPNVNGAILRKVIKWSKHHKNDPPVDYAKQLEEQRFDLVVDYWDQRFLNEIVQEGAIFKLTKAADYMQVDGLLHAACKIFANFIKSLDLDLNMNLELIREKFKTNVNAQHEDYLPLEPMSLIFSFIEDFRMKGKLENVCERWHDILMRDGWKKVTRISLNYEEFRYIEPLGSRCGRVLVDCCFNKTEISSNLICLIAKSFPVLKHLEFRYCKFNELNAQGRESFKLLGSRLRSLNFYATDYHHQMNELLSYHFTQLRHLGLHSEEYSIFYDNSSSQLHKFSTGLRSLYLNNFTHPPDLEQILTKVKNNSPELSALYLDNPIIFGQSLQLLSKFHSLRFIHIALNSEFAEPESLRRCLDNLQKLGALQLQLEFENFTSVFRSITFRNLFHLSLVLPHYSSNNYEFVGKLSTVAPQLRSLNFNIPSVDFSSDGNKVYVDLALEQTDAIGREILKIAKNGNLEHLKVLCASFSLDQLHELIKNCPNLKSLGVQLTDKDAPIPRLRDIVAEQWEADTRTYTPLWVWIYGDPAEHHFRDPFLSAHTVPFGFTQPDPVLDVMFNNELFNDKNGGGTPSFVTERYSSIA